jgi:hypothetical protein
MDGLDTFHEQPHANRCSLFALLTEGLEEVLRNDDIAKDAFASLSTRPVV